MLRALGEDINGYGRELIPKILRAFPTEICQRWIVHVKRQGLSEGDILKLMEFLVEEVDGALTAQKICGDTLIIRTTSYQLRRFTSILSIRNQDRHTGNQFCVFCETKGHLAQDCRRLTEVSERRDKLKSAHRCFLCLNRGHSTKVCSKKGRALCTKCKGAHHRSIYNDAGTAIKPSRESTATTVGKIDIASPDSTNLQTARIWVLGPTGLSKLTRCVLDGGSQSSFIAKTLIDDHKLEVVDRRDLVVSAFESRSSDSSPLQVMRFCAKSIWNNTTVPITAFENSHSFCPHHTTPYDIIRMAQTRKLQLTDLS